MRKNRRLTELPDDLSELISGQNTPEEIYLRGEKEQRVFEEIERLRETDGDCFYLFAVCGRLSGMVFEAKILGHETVSQTASVVIYKWG